MCLGGGMKASWCPALTAAIAGAFVLLGAVAACDNDYSPNNSPHSDLDADMDGGGGDTASDPQTPDTGRDVGGDDGPPSDPWRSGARLRAMVVDGGDGAQLFAGWWDSELGVACQFRLVDRATARCFPVVGGIEGAGPFFSDADCTEPGVLWFPPGEVPALVVRGVESVVAPRCEPNVPNPNGDYFHLVPGPRPETLYNGGNGASCGEIDTNFPDRFRWFGLEPVPHERFVGARVTVEGGPIGVRWYAGEDGSVEVASLRDGEGRDCDLVRPSEGVDVCLPVDYRPATTLDVYSDALCSAGLLGFESGLYCGSGTLAVFPLTACPNARAGPGHALSAARVGPTSRTFRRELGMEPECAGVNLGNLDGFHQVVETVPWDTFPSAGYVERGGGRLRVRFGLSSSGVPARNPDTLDQGARQPYWFEDTTHGEVCRPELTSPGVTRCIPEGPAEAEFGYLDPDCTQPGLLVLRNGCGTTGPPIAREYRSLDDQNLEIGWILRAIPGADPSPSWFYRRDTGRGFICEPVVDESGSVLIAPTDRIPIEEFAIVSERRE